MGIKRTLEYGQITAGYVRVKSHKYSFSFISGPYNLRNLPWRYPSLIKIPQPENTVSPTEVVILICRQQGQDTCIQTHPEHPSREQDYFSVLLHFCSC